MYSNSNVANCAKDYLEGYKEFLKTCLCIDKINLGDGSVGSCERALHKCLLYSTMSLCCVLNTVPAICVKGGDAIATAVEDKCGEYQPIAPSAQGMRYT